MHDIISPKSIIAINITIATRLLAFVCLFATHAANAQVVSMSRVTTVQTDTGSYQQFSVNCGSRSEPRFVRKVDNSREWCDALTSEFCARDRLTIADQVCSGRYTAAMQAKQSEIPSEGETEAPQQQERQAELIVQQPQATSTDQAASEDEANSSVTNPVTQNNLSKTALERELRDIEQQLIDLQAEQLDLRAKDLELMKQQVEPQP